MHKVNNFDNQCFELALKTARVALEKDNFPVGAVLVIDGEIVDAVGNEIYERNSFIYHAENTLVMNNSEKLAEARNSKKTTSIYSTFEPCIQCIGVLAINHIDKVFYIQDDPYAGACNLDRSSIGKRYAEKWPEIIHVPYTTESEALVRTHLTQELQSGDTERAKKFLELLDSK